MFRLKRRSRNNPFPDWIWRKGPYTEPSQFWREALINKNWLVPEMSWYFSRWLPVRILLIPYALRLLRLLRRRLDAGKALPVNPSEVGMLQEVNADLQRRLVEAHGRADDLEDELAQAGLRTDPLADDNDDEPSP